MELSFYENSVFVSPFFLVLQCICMEKNDHKYLINPLHNIELAESYTEALRYENYLLIEPSTPENTPTAEFMQ